jgi:DNA-binding HxlR family transcriptional regulator
MTKDEPVTIVDRDVLKVISADTRMDIMKELGEGARTPSFLGKKFNKSNATIVEHLHTMEKHGLVKRVEQPGKKFVFYTLTGKGQGIISSKSRRLVIILSVSVLFMVGGIFSMGNYFYGLYSLQSMRAAGISGAANETGAAESAAQKNLGKPADVMYPPPEFPDVIREEPFPFYLYLGLSLLGAAVLGIILYIRGRSKFNISGSEEMFLC